MPFPDTQILHHVPVNLACTHDTSGTTVFPPFFSMPKALVLTQIRLVSNLVVPWVMKQIKDVTLGIAVYSRVQFQRQN